MIESHIKNLNTNPFFSSLIFQAFYKGYHKDQCPLLIQYLVLPVVLFSETRKPLMDISIRSSLTDFVNKNKLQLLGLQENIWKFRQITNETLIYLHNHKKIELTSIVDVIESINYEKYPTDIKNYLRAAHYFGFLLSDEDVLSVFRTLNVIP